MSDKGGDWKWTFKRKLYTILISLYIISLFVLIFVGVLIDNAILIGIGLSMQISPLVIIYLCITFQWFCNLIIKIKNKIVNRSKNNNDK